MSPNNEQDNEQLLPPHSAEAEEAVLGSVMIDPDTFMTVSGFLSAADFYLVKHQWVWEAMVALDSRGDDIDNVTVIHELRIAGRLEDIGGSAFITQLVNNTPTHVHAETYARIVEHASIRRKLIKVCGEIVQSALTENSPLPVIIQQAHDKITESTKIRHNGGFKMFSEFASENYDRVDAVYNGKGELLGIPTGLKTLDDVLCGNGWQPGKFYIVAGRPGMGKSAFAGGAAVTAAKHGKHVVIISKEMTGNDLHFRAMAGEINISTNKMKSAQMDETEFGRFVEGIGRTSEFPIAVDDGGIDSINQLTTELERLHREWGIDLVIVDYLQLLYSEDKKPENRNLEISAISRKFKKLSITLRVPIIALSQLSRKVEERKDKRPMLSDLRDSGSLEQDADFVMFIYRDDYYDESSVRPNEADFIIAKQRDGDTVPVSVGWVRNVTKFIDIRHDQEAIDLVSEWNDAQ